MAAPANSAAGGGATSGGSAAAAGDSQAIIFQWLDRIGLSYVTPHLKSAGVAAPDDLMRLTEADFPRLTVTAPTDQKRLSELINRVRQAHANNLERKPRRGPEQGPSPQQQPPASNVATAHASGSRGTEDDSTGGDGLAYFRAGGSQPQPVAPAAAAVVARTGVVEPPSGTAATSTGGGVRAAFSHLFHRAAPVQPPAVDAGAAPVASNPSALLPSSTNVSGTRAKSGVDRDGFEVRRARAPTPPVPAVVAAAAAAAAYRDGLGSPPPPQLGGASAYPSGSGPPDDDDDAAASAAASGAAAARRARPSLGVGVMPSQRAMLSKLQAKDAAAAAAGGAADAAAATAAAKRKSMGGGPPPRPSAGGSGGGSSSGSSSSSSSSSSSNNNSVGVLSAAQSGPTSGNGQLRRGHDGAGGGGPLRPGSAPQGSPPPISAYVGAGALGVARARTAAPPREGGHYLGSGGGVHSPMLMEREASGLPTAHNGAGIVTLQEEEEGDMHGDDEVGDDEGYFYGDEVERSASREDAAGHRLPVHHHPNRQAARQGAGVDPLGGSGILEEDGGGAKIKVVVRKRPLNKRERAATAKGEDMDVVQVRGKGGILRGVFLSQCVELERAYMCL